MGFVVRVDRIGRPKRNTIVEEKLAAWSQSYLLPPEVRCELTRSIPGRGKPPAGRCGDIPCCRPRCCRQLVRFFLGFFAERTEREERGEFSLVVRA